MLGEALHRGEAAQAQQIIERLGSEQEVMRRMVDDLPLLARIASEALVDPVSGDAYVEGGS